MKIGIDLDGVVFDSESTFRVYEEIFALEDLNKREIINREEPKYQGRYDWSREERNAFNEKYLRLAGLESNLMSGFLAVYKRLKQMNHEMIVITARGMFIPSMKEDAEELLRKNNIVFDKYYFDVRNKTQICKKENIDVMIDDDYKIINDLVNEKIKTLYFRAANLKKLEESEYMHEVNNWGDIYRYFVEENCKVLRKK